MFILCSGGLSIDIQLRKPMLHTHLVATVEVIAPADLVAPADFVCCYGKHSVVQLTRQKVMLCATWLQ